MNREDLIRLAQLAHQLESEGMGEEADQIDQAITGLDKGSNGDDAAAASRLVDMVVKELHVKEGFEPDDLNTPEGQARVLEALYEQITNLQDHTKSRG